MADPLGGLMTDAPLIKACAVTRVFAQRGGLFARALATRAVDGVSLAIGAGEVVALVGESGSGKSTLGRMLLGLAAPTAGAIRYRGAPIAGLRKAAWRTFRREVQMVFQDTGASLNPRRAIGASVAVPLRYHMGLGRRAARDGAAALLDRVGLEPGRFLDRLPHELSGGQRQRVGIARAIACRPRLLIADEPVSALDVSVRAQILQLMLELRREQGLAYLFITHDLGVVRAIADRVAVMRHGVLVEEGDVRAVLEAPAHPYTRALLDAVPVPDPGARRRH